MDSVSLLVVPLGFALLSLLLFCFFRPKAGLNLVVLALPLYWVPESFTELLGRLMTSSQIPIVADALAIATFLGALLIRRRSTHPRRLPITLTLCAFIVCAALSMMNSSDWSRSVGNLGTYMQLAVMTFVIESIPENPDDLQRLLRYWLLSLGVVLIGGLFGAYSAFAGLDNVLVMTGQVRSTFRFPNQLSLYLVITGPLVSAYVVSRCGSARLRLLAIVAIVLTIAVLFYSGSRSGVAAALAAGAVLLAFHGRRLLLYIPAVLIVGAGILWLSTSSGGENWDAVRDRYAFFSQALSRQGTSEFDFYAMTNEVGWQAFADHPIVGGGVGAVVDTDIATDQPYEIHNTYVGILGQTGALGFAAFALVLVVAGRNLALARTRARSPLVRALAEACAAGLIACGVHAYGNFDWRIRHLWLLVAFTSVVRMAAERERAAVFGVETARSVRRAAPLVRATASSAL